MDAGLQPRLSEQCPQLRFVVTLAGEPAEIGQVFHGT